MSGFMHCLISTHIGMFSALANTHQAQLIVVGSRMCKEGCLFAWTSFLLAGWSTVNSQLILWKLSMLLCKASPP